MSDQELLLRLGSRSDAAEQTLQNHWLHCTPCRRSRTNEQMCALGQRLAQASWQAFKAWDELDTQLNFPELVKKDGAA